MNLETLLKPFFPIIILLVMIIILSGYYSFFKNHALVQYVKKKYPKFYASFCTSKFNTLKPILWMKFIWNEQSVEDTSILKYKRTLRISTIWTLSSFVAVLVIFIILFALVYLFKIN